LVTNPLRSTNFVVPFPPAVARCQAPAAAPSTERRDASHRFCPPRGYPRFIGRCFISTMRPSDSLHRVGPASRYACAVPTLTALRSALGSPWHTTDSATDMNTAFDTVSRTRGPGRRRDDAGPPSVSHVTFPRSHPAPQPGLPRYRTSRFLARSSSQPALGFTFVVFRGSARTSFRFSVMPETPLSSPRGSLWPGAHSGLAPPRHMACEAQ
jgi:hypothetical protein